MLSTFDLGIGIAIIGMAGRFPGARNVAEFWGNLRDGVESIRVADDAELRAMGVDEALLHDPNYVKAVAVLDGMELFDATFFGYTPREAELIDPQHRIFLECAWEALETAGYDPTIYRGAVGVFAGATTNTYLLLNLFSSPGFVSTLDPVQIEVSNGVDFLATRVSYNLNLKGPSCTVQTACSTSLTAIHYACQSLLNEECDLALAGGVTVQAQHRLGYRYLEGSIVSPDGHCRAFDAQAAGIVVGSGVGIVVLKRLEDAIADGDHVRAVIRGSAINNDGADKAGYTAPSVEGQAKVITEALAVAGVEADTITYVETHGTGTRLGDPVEVLALTKAFREGTTRNNYCAIGSVKTNVGHLSGAAGVTSLIKTVLALENGLILPSLHFKRPNPKIDFANSPFFVNTELTEWKTNKMPRRAGVSSFGMGGTNVHAVLEEAPALEPSGPSRPMQLLLLSAKTDAALEVATTNLVDHLRQYPDLNLADVAYTLQTGRRAFGHRRVAMCRDLGDAVETLAACNPRRVFTDTPQIQDRPVAFMFTGQGAQYVNMALDLYQTEPIFCKQVDVCSELLQPHLGFDLREALYPDARRLYVNEDATRQLNKTMVTQPALFVIEYALAQLWMSWGVCPRAMIGHSIGEYVAACLAGVFSLEDALALVAARGRLMQALPSGSMIAVPLSETEMEPFLGADLSIAAVNASSRSIVSGSTEAIETLQNRLEEQGVTCRRLYTSHAFHSAMIDPVLGPFAERVGQVTLNAPQIPYVSNVTGIWIEAAEATDPAYWAQHLRQTVRFSDGVRTLIEHDATQVFLEVGPGHTLTKLVRRHLPSTQSQVVLSSTRHHNEQGADTEFIFTTLGKLWLAGVSVDWPGLYAREQRRRLPLPTYPFERQRYWVEPGARTHVTTASLSSPHKRANVSEWFYVPAWKSSVLPRLLDLDDLAEQEGGWLLFTDKFDLGAEMASRLREAGQEVTIVQIGNQFERVADGVYTINPRQRDDYSTLLDEMGDLPRQIVHLWGLTSDEKVQPGSASFGQCQDFGFYSLLFLVQAFGERNVTGATHIDVISDHIHSVVVNEVVHPEKAPLLGLCKVIPQEYPSVTCRYIDVVLPEPGIFQSARLVDWILAEVHTQSVDTTVAYRGDQRWVRTFEPVYLENKSKPIRPLRQSGVYLITGGLSGVGLALARYLARTVQARLVLLDKDTPGTGDVFGDDAGRQTEIVKSLQDLGAQVLVINTDVADEAQVRDAIAEAVAHFGLIHGVIYAAAANGEKVFGPIQEIDRITCNAYFELIVRGLFALERALRDQTLDLCLVNSSLSTVLGGTGFAVLAAADSFVDIFVQERNKMGNLPWISVNWDAWQLEDNAGLITSLSADLARLALSPAEGGEALWRILAASTGSRVVVSTDDLTARMEQTSQRFQPPRSQAFSKELSRYERPDLQINYVPPRNDLEREIAEIWQRTLGIKKVGVHDDFFELGGDSLLGAQLIFQARQSLGMDIPLANLLKRPTVAYLADYVETVRWAARGSQSFANQGGVDREEGVL